MWDFIQNELLGMRWLNTLTGTILQSCRVDTGTRMGGSIHFFSVRYNKNHDSARFSDFCDFSYSELFSAGKNKEHSQPFSRSRGKYRYNTEVTT